MSAGKKRFIAGATCPQCKAVDRIVVYRDGDMDYRECVECGFKDAMRFRQTVREMQTRVNTTVEQVRAETQTVRLIDPQPGQDKKP